MSYSDLELEFEDEDVSKDKKNEAVRVDVDLEFHTSEAAKVPPRPAARPASPAGTNPSIQRPAARGTTPSIPIPAGVVRKISEARPAATQQARRAVSNQTQPKMVSPLTVGSSAVKAEPQHDVESNHVSELRERMRQVEFDAEVRVQVAEFKTDILSELLSDIKLMEHQIGQLLARINAKHPDVKNEALMIKKILADFTSKKRK
jgi:hypothetical protein